MKRIITASTRGPEDCFKLCQLLDECEELVGELEDAYFGEDIVDDFIKCWKSIQTANKHARKALMKSNI